jgi:RNA polymerase sigma-70 factor (ECF subfamily)
MTSRGNEAGNEADTIALAVEGEELAQRRLYETYRAAACRLACLLLRDTHDAEEVVQDAFVYALRNVERYDPGKGSFWTWLRVIVVSRCRNKRRRRRLPRVSLDVLREVGLVPAEPRTMSNPVHVLELSETRRMIWEALSRVSPGARDALVLRYYDGLSYLEIAESLGCSSEAARARVAHGKVQMRRLLSAAGEKAELEVAAPRAARARSG